MTKDMGIALPHGWRVKIEALLVEEATSGILEGSPDAIWDGVMDRAPLDAQECWGDHNIHIITPVSTSRTQRQLPKWKVSVWLTCDKVISELDADGSDLVVVFFADRVLDKPPNDLVRDAVASLNWPALAGDFAY